MKKVILPVHVLGASVKQRNGMTNEPVVAVGVEGEGRGLRVEGCGLRVSVEGGSHD